MTITAKEKSPVEHLEDESFGGCTPRIRKARQRIQTTPASICLEKAKIMTEVFMKTEGEPMVMRRAKAFRELCNRKTIFIQDDELIVGYTGSKLRSATLNPDTDGWILSDELDTIATRPQDPFLITDEQKKLFREFIEPYWQGKSFWDIWQATAPDDLLKLEETVTIISSRRAESGHGLFTANYSLILKLGIIGIKKRIKQKLATLDAAVPGHFDKITYLNALLIVCEGIEILAKKYAQLAKQKADEETDPRRKAELEKIAEICQQVPSRPARNFHEALQSLFLYHICLGMDYGSASHNLGRLDQYIYPYYKKDIEEGRLLKDEAQELLESLWIKLGEVMYIMDKDYARFVPGYGRFQQATCGGLTASGQDGVNDISYMMIQATMNIRLAQPNLSVKYNKRRNPDSFLRKIAELVALGIGLPQCYNDEAGMKHIMDMGIPFEDAYNWSPHSCKDLGLMGKIGNLRLVTGVNLGCVLDLTLLNGIFRLTGNRLPVLQTGDPGSFKTYDEFKNAFKTQISFLIKKAAEIGLIVEQILQEEAPAILVSLSFEECIENARDCMAGGAKYNPGPEITTGGLADTFNSLLVIKKLIYDEKKLTWNQLLEALDKDFEGYEDIRQMCLAVPKYGNDIDEVDEIATEITRFAAEEINKYKGLYGGKRISSAPASAGHLYSGVKVGALPSGRKAWVPLSDGASPMQGTDTNGPTAVLKSLSKFALEQYGTILLNMKIDPSVFNDERGFGDFMGLMKSWHDLGLYNVQFNVVSPETLRDAQVHPEKHRDLMVRVSGYCAYFVDLNKGIQDDIIARSTFTALH